MLTITPRRQQVEAERERERGGGAKGALELVTEHKFVYKRASRFRKLIYACVRERRECERGRVIEREGVVSIYCLYI